jgi:hypothetical protein
MAQLTIERRPPGFLHLTVNVKSGEGIVERRLVEERLNKAKDWLRYAPNSWLIYTSHNAVHWGNVLRSIDVVSANTTFLICEVNLENRSGWLNRSVWDWINKNRMRYRSSDQVE